MLKVYERKQDCYGCGACCNICENDAICMQPDAQGFLYPTIDQTRCVDCKMCTQACPIQKEKLLLSVKPDVIYGVKCADDIRAQSSSGGFYTLLSNYILSIRGEIYGTRYAEDMNVKHDLATNPLQRDRFRGSKYVQSDIGKTYISIEKTLKAGKAVLFTGTPCQVAALKQYLKVRHVDTQKLLLNDIVCHGVPSPKLWKEYIQFLETRHQGKLISFSFRNKEAGWRGYHIKAMFSDGRTICDDSDTQSYTKMFSLDIMLRPSCYYCPFAQNERCGDITIGDFWGIEKIDCDYSDNQGISMVFANSQEGQALLHELVSTEDLSYKTYLMKQILQPALYMPTDFGLNYDFFWRDYKKHGFVFVARKYGEFGLIGRFFHYVHSAQMKLMRL